MLTSWRGLIVCILVVHGYWSVTTFACAKKIQLCINQTSTKNRELLVDLLELRLLMLPQIETQSCEDKSDIRDYRFGQNIKEIVGTKIGRPRYEVVSALYDRKGRVLFGQLEFIERTSRKLMNERAKILALNIVNAIHENQEMNYPFLKRDTIVDRSVLRERTGSGRNCLGVCRRQNFGGGLSRL